MKYFFFILAAVFSHNVSAADVQPVFLHLQGSDPSTTSKQLNQEIQDTFLTPVDQLKTRVIYSQVSQAYGNKDFFVNFILEPAGNLQQAAVDEYVHSLEGRIFHGSEVHFQTVSKILESATILAGTYVQNRQDPFQQKYALLRKYEFSTLREWRDFTNAYGGALLDHDNRKLMTFLRRFVADDEIFERFRDRALATSNMMAISPAVTLVLSDGSTSGPAMETTPFLPFKFFRNCYSQSYENGMCWPGK
jgi:hypothetical protein